MLFHQVSFSKINLSDNFFNSLKEDYPGSSTSTGFVEWFKKKTSNSEKAYIAENEEGIFAFIYIKKENEEIDRLGDTTLPAEERLKIGTFRIDESRHGERLGEGAMGLIHWIWQRLKINVIYVTVFEKQVPLISLLKKFGFRSAGKNLNGELILIKDKRCIDFRDSYKSYPFISKKCQEFGYICIDDDYHDTMFPYSTLRGRPENVFERCVSNGISKVYVGKAPRINHSVGEPVFIYRKDTHSSSPKRYVSCLTSFALITNVIVAKRAGRELLSFEDAIRQIKNKSVFDVEELRARYRDDNNFNIIELLYLGYFGSGNNINMDWLDNNGMWCNHFRVSYPTEVKLDQPRAVAIFEEAGKDVSTILC